MHKKLGYFLTILICTLIVVGVIFTFYTLSTKGDLEKEIVINSDGKAHDVLEVNSMKLFPSEKKLYDIGLTSKLEGTFHVRLDFNEIEDGGMKEFVDVVIKVGEEEIFEGKLSYLLGDYVVEFDSLIKKTSLTIIEIEYSMSEEVSNEAKNTFSSFNIDLTIERK